MAEASSILECPPPDPRQFDPLARPLPSRMNVLLEWLAGQPLVPPALGLMTGIALDAAWAIPFILLLLIFIAAGVAILCFKQTDGARHLAAALAALCIGAMLHDVTYWRWPADCIVRYCGSSPTPARLTGTVMAAPLVRESQTGRIRWFSQAPVTRLIVSAEELEGVRGPIRVQGAVSVRVSEPVLGVRAGDRVVLFGRLYRPAAAADSNDERDWARISRRNGILVAMTCDHDENVIVLPPAKHTSRWRHVLTDVRQRARLAMLDRTWPGDVPGSNLLEALVLGQRSAVDPAINQAFVDTGTVHYLSVSGAHVGMLASALWGIAVLTGLSRRATASWIAVAITAYGLLAEPTPPVWRSVIMGDVLCGAALMRRPVRVANWLALSAIILLVIHPTDLFDPGFQLSFGTLISLIYLGPPIGRLIQSLFRRARRVNDPLLTPEIQKLLHPHPIRRVGWAIERFVALSLGVGIAAWLAGIAPGAWHFHQVSLWGWLNSLLLAPLVWGALVIGLAKTVLGTVWPVLGGALAVPLTWITDLLIATVRLLTHLPGSPLPPVHVTAAGVAASSAILLLWMLRGWLRPSPRALGVTTLAFVVIAAWRLAPRADTGELRVDILSVGSGSAHLIQLPGGKTLLYDIGARPPYDIQRWTLGPLTARHNLYTIDALILSHPDLDHFSSVPDLLDRTSVRTAVTTELFQPLSLHDAPSGRLVRELESRRLAWHTIRRGQTLTGTGDAQVECLWPPPADDVPTIMTTNDSSMVLRLTSHGRRILLCGDIEDYAQRRLIREADLRADVLVLPHHGAVTPYTGMFIEAVKPTWCIRSSGQRDAQTRSHLPALVTGLQYFNTADHGDIVITVTPTNLAVQPSRPPP